jgi:hypothetical protein
MKFCLGFVIALCLTSFVSYGNQPTDVKIIGSGYLKGSWRVINDDGDEVCTEIYIYQSSQEIQCND